MNRRLQVRSLFFMYGLVSHGLIFGLQTELFRGTGIFVKHWLEMPALLIFAASATSWLFPNLILRGNRRAAGVLCFALRGCLAGVLATGCGIVALLLVSAILLGINSSERLLLIPLTSFFALLGLATYGLSDILELVPFGAGSGLLAGLISFAVAKYFPAEQRTRVDDFSRESAAIGFISLALFWRIWLGEALGIAALMGGIYNLRAIPDGEVLRKRWAIAAIVLGAASLLVIFVLRWA